MHQSRRGAEFGFTSGEVQVDIARVMARKDGKQPYTVISRNVHIHPTVTELVPTLLQQLRPVV